MATIIARDTTPYAITVDKNAVYWSDVGGNIMRLPKWLSGALGSVRRGFCAEIDFRSAPDAGTWIFAIAAKSREADTTTVWHRSTRLPPQRYWRPLLVLAVALTPGSS
jgi:hypothetical protein